MTSISHHYGQLDCFAGSAGRACARTSPHSKFPSKLFLTERTHQTCCLALRPASFSTPEFQVHDHRGIIVVQQSHSSMPAPFPCRASLDLLTVARSHAPSLQNLVVRRKRNQLRKVAPRLYWVLCLSSGHKICRLAVNKEQS